MANIVLLKSLFESYEDLAEMRTLNSKTGEIVFLAVASSKDDTLALLESVKAELDVRIVPEPADLSGDWLLGQL